MDFDTLIWLERVDNVLSKVSYLWSGPVIFVGDMNIDMTKADENISNKYVEIMQCYDLHQHVTQPTRKGKALIDHIWTNIPNKVKVSDLLLCDEVSDHDAPYVFINTKVDFYHKKCYKFIRHLRAYDENDHINDVKLLPFNIVHAVEDPDEKISLFNDILLECMNRHAPLKRTKITPQPAPWMRDISIQQLKQKRDQARYLAFQTNDVNDRQNYVSLRNEIKSTIKIAKREFYKTALSSKRPSQVWKVINKILKPKLGTVSPKDIDDLNKHFTTTAQRILGSTPSKPTELINEHQYNKDCFKFSQVSYLDVLQEIKALRNDCSTGNDDIPVWLIKPIAEVITSPLTHIINSCIDINYFPKIWKVGKVVPIPKNDSSTTFDDFRSITVLSTLSKLYERLMCKQS